MVPVFVRVAGPLPWMNPVMVPLLVMFMVPAEWIPTAPVRPAVIVPALLSVSDEPRALIALPAPSAAVIEPAAALVIDNDPSP